MAEESKFEQKYADYVETLQNIANPYAESDIDEEVLRETIRGLTPSIYNADAEIVATSDPDELARFKQGLVNKGYSTEASVDADTDYAIDRYGSSNRRKKRAVLYYIIRKR